MSALLCDDCGAVWVSDAARELMDDSHGCLRCDGTLHEISDAEADEHMTRGQDPG